MKPPLKKNKNVFAIGKEVLAILLLSVLSLSCSSKEANSREKSERTVLLNAVEEFNAAFAQGNIGRLEELITANYQHTNGSSRAIGKEDWLAYLSKRQKTLKDGTLKVHAYSMDQVGAEIFGATAIVTARVQVDRTQNGLREQSKFRITTLWVKESGTWKRAGFHDGRIE